MGTRRSDADELAQRCRRAGWRVERNRSGGWKVWNLQGRSDTIHGSMSDSNSLMLVTKSLDLLGLSDDEKALKMARLNESRTRAQVARDAADKRAKELAAKAAVTKAAGPYLSEPEPCDLDWLTTPHPAPWMRWMTITPKAAAQILEHHNVDNRPLDPKRVTHYRNIILARKWKLTHQGIAFDTRGICQDAQHRLSAIVEASQLDPEIDGVPFAVFVGMPVDNFAVIDEGKLRTAAQLFAKGSDKKSNAKFLQTCVRLVHYADDVDARTSQRLRLPNVVIVEEYDADAEHFDIAVAFGRTNANLRRIPTTAGPLAAAHYLLYRANGRDNVYVDMFFEGLITGVEPGSDRLNLEDVDPRRVLRQRLISLRASRTRLTALTQLGMFIATWNNCVASRRPRNLVFGDDNPIPAIITCKPGEGAPPAAFRTVPGVTFRSGQ